MPRRATSASWSGRPTARCCWPATAAPTACAPLRWTAASCWMTACPARCSAWPSAPTTRPPRWRWTARCAATARATAPQPSPPMPSSPAGARQAWPSAPTARAWRWPTPQRARGPRSSTRPRCAAPAGCSPMRSLAVIGACWPGRPTGDPSISAAPPTPRRCASRCCRWTWPAAASRPPSTPPLTASPTSSPCHRASWPTPALTAAGV